MMTSLNSLKHYPLSSPQREIWFDQILHPEVPRYNIGGYLRIDGPIDPAIFEKALNQVIEKNDALRIMLFKEKTLPTQVFVENIYLNLDYYDFSTQENPQKQALDWMQSEFIKPFQLYKNLLFQFALCKISDHCYYWFKKYHHLIADGWNHCLIAQRVAIAYNALLLGQTADEQKQYSYLDFIQNDQTYLDSKEFSEDKDYWFDKFPRLPAPMIPRQYAEQFKSKTIPCQRAVLHLERAFYNELTAFAKENNSSTFQLILGVLYCYFVRTSTQKELVIGLPILNRSTPSFKQTAGLFTKVIPAHFDFGTNLNFLKLIKLIGIESRQGARHKRFPISELNRQLKIGKENRQQIFDLALIYLDNNYNNIQFAGSSVEMRLLTHGIEQNALMIFVNDFDKQRQVKIDFDYSLGAFDEAEIERLKARFQCLLEEVLQRPHVAIQELNIMPEQEHHQILVEWNNTQVDYPKDVCLHELFEAQVERTPDAIAIIFENKQLSYSELNQRANQLAHYLIRLGVKQETLVGICIERSLEIVVGLLGILKAGGAYVPLDPTYPRKRLAFIIKDAQVSILVTQTSLLSYLPQQKAQLLCLDTEWEIISQLDSKSPVSEIKPENLCYVIYTSGSTGKPKGVTIEHHSAVVFLTWAKKVFLSTEIAGVLASTSICFDLSIFELFVPLSWGGKIILVENVLHLSTLPLDSEVTLINTVPSAMAELIRTNSIPNSVEVVNLAGELLQKTLVQKIYQQQTIKRVYNLYGPSEDTTYSTFALIAKNKDQLPYIGYPITNTQVYVLDEKKQPVPIGVYGELYLGGDGLARGYLNRPKLTAEKFIPNPFNNHSKARLYKTGDLARYLPDGNLEYLGRIDNQVKIRGFRIELGEIETILNKDSTVQAAVVIAREDEPGNKRLIAYIVSHQELTTEAAHYRAHLYQVLREKLPNYMIPSDFVFLKTLPLTPNGKVDRKALPQPDEQRDLETAYLAPETEIEQKIARIVQSVLHVNQIGVHDNFFELGGNSLLLIQVQEKLIEVLNQEVPVLTLFEYPTISALAHYLDEKSSSEQIALKKGYDRAYKQKAAIPKFRKHHTTNR